MKIQRSFILYLFIISGLVFARTGKDVKRAEEKTLKVNSQYYWVKDHVYDDNKGQLDRKRSHKRRRKIRKPIKGLR